MYQKLTFLEMPHVCFAHEYATSNYDIHFTAAPKQMEFTFYEKGDVIRAMEDGSEEPVAQGTYQLALFDKPFRMYSCAPACSHITVGFRAAYRLSGVSREELLAVNRRNSEEELSVYFPTEGLQLDEHNPMKGLLQRLSILSSLPENASKLRCTALLLELMALLTERRFAPRYWKKERFHHRGFYMLAGPSAISLPTCRKKSHWTACLRYWEFVPAI